MNLKNVLLELKNRIECNKGLDIVYSKNGNNFEGWVQAEICDIMITNLKITNFFVETKCDIETENACLMIKMFSKKNSAYNEIFNDIKKLKTCTKSKYMIVIVFPDHYGKDSDYFKNGLKQFKTTNQIPFTFPVSNINGLIYYGQL